MDLTESIFKVTAQELNKTTLKFRGFDIDLTKPFRRVSMVDMITESCGVNFNNIKSLDEALSVANEHHIKIEDHQKSIGHIINLFFEKYCEEKCIQPTFVHTYPLDVSPLTKKNKDNPEFTDRFELFIGQKEFANAYSELNDPIEQLERFQSQMEELKKGNQEA
jgi:lysyl-tRNA synthetase class 2